MSEDSKLSSTEVNGYELTHQITIHSHLYIVFDTMFPLGHIEGLEQFVIRNSSLFKSYQGQEPV